MPNNHCSLGWYESEQIKPIQPRDLPISLRLIERLQNTTKADELSLALELQAELSSDYKVVYLDEQSGKVVHLDKIN